MNLFTRFWASRDCDVKLGRIGMALATLLLVCCVAWFPHAEAFAWFNDVTESYPASQEVPISGDVLTGADIPEGTYSITATASSYMCKFTNVTLTSVGGELWATFTLSKAYNALYFGTAEEAAAATNEDGTDYSAYYVSDPLEGYVARQFSLPIPALNYEITIATFSGGSKGVKEGMWYTRTVVFNSSDEVMRAIESGGNPQPEDESGKSDGADQPSGGSDGTNDGGSEDPVDDAATDTDSGDDSSDDGSDDDDSSSKSKASSKVKNDGNVNSGTRANDSNGNANNQPAVKEPESKDDNADKKEPARPKPEGNYKIGQEISFVGLDEIPLAELPAQTIAIDQQKAERDESAAVAVVVGIVLVNLVLVGAFLAMVRRSRPRRFPRV